MSHTDETESAIDEELPFQTTASSETTRNERLYRKLDRYLLAPARIIWDDWRGKLGVLIIGMYLLMGTVGVVVLPEPHTDTMNILRTPFETWKYPLGTDNSGQGILRKVVHATPPMLKMILAGGIFAVSLGAIVGMVSGYKGGRVDSILMSITDTLMALPGLPLIIVLSFLIDPSNPYFIGVIISINAWTGLARSIRSQMLPLRDIEYVEANRLMGIPTRTILARDIVPNLAPYIAINFVLASRRIIFQSVALYFLGVLSTSKPNWGVMINLAYRSGGALYGWGAAHWLLVPMLAVVLFSLGFVLLSQAADRLFNPRIRARHQETTADEEAPEA